MDDLKELMAKTIRDMQNAQPVPEYQKLPIYPSQVDFVRDHYGQDFIDQNCFIVKPLPKADGPVWK